MSRPTSTPSRARRLAAGSLVGLAALGGLTASAEANFQKTLTYSCIYPYVGEQPLTVAIDAAIPASWPTKTKTPAFPIDVVATSPGNTSSVPAAIGAVSVEGAFKIGSTIASTAQSPLPITITTAVPQQPVPSSGAVSINASGAMPQFQILNGGPTKITVDAFGGYLSFRDDAGVLIPLEPWYNGPAVEPGPDPTKQPLLCTLAPPNQDTTLAQIVSFAPPPTATPTVSPSPTPTPTPEPTATPSATPSAPTGVVVTPRETGVDISWNASPASEGIVKYEVGTISPYTGPMPNAVTTTETSASVGGLERGSRYTAYVRAINAAGDESAGTTVNFTTLGLGGPTPTPTPTSTPTPTPPPSTPIPIHNAPLVGGLTITELTSTSGKVCWNGGGDERVPDPLYYSISISPGGGTGAYDGPSNCRVLGGLVPGTTYTVTVSGRGANQVYGYAAHNATFEFTTPGAPTPTPTVTPEPTPTVTPTSTPTPTDQVIPYAYSLAGSATLKTLTKGSLPLSGGIDAKLGLPSGNFTGTLALNPSTGNLTALGFLPVVAKVNIVPTEQVTGTLRNGKLTATAKVRIKLPSVKTFGIELAGGANCQAKQISSITLSSTQSTFLPLSGGPIAGTFDISDLSGCGFLTGIVSPLTKGNGNAIALNLTPKPVTA